MTNHCPLPPRGDLSAQETRSLRFGHFLRLSGSRTRDGLMPVTTLLPSFVT